MTITDLFLLFLALAIGRALGSFIWGFIQERLEK